MNRAIGVSDQEARLRTRIIYWLVKRRQGQVHLGNRLRARDPRLLELAFQMDVRTASQPPRLPRTRPVEQRTNHLERPQASESSCQIM